MSEPTTAVSKRPDSDGLTLRDMAKAAIAARMTKGLTEPAIIAIMLKAEELGVPPMQALSQIHVINGVPSCSAQLMLSLAYQRLPGFEFELMRSDSEICEARMRRGGDKPWLTIKYTYAQAQTAKLTGKDNWQHHPDDMLRNRVVSKLLKMVAPDTFAGVYTVDEAESIAPRIHVETELDEVRKLLKVEDDKEPGVDDGAPERPVAVDVTREPVVEVKVEPDLENSAFLNWVEALDQADSTEQLDAHIEAIELDMRLDLALRAMLKTRADGVRDKLGGAGR